MIKANSELESQPAMNHTLAISIEIENAHATEDKSIDGECPICHDPAQVLILDRQQVPGQKLVSRSSGRTSIPLRDHYLCSF